MAASDNLHADQFKGWGLRHPQEDGKPGSWLAQSNSRNAKRARTAVAVAGTVATSGGAAVLAHLMGY